VSSYYIFPEGGSSFQHNICNMMDNLSALEGA